MHSHRLRCKTFLRIRKREKEIDRGGDKGKKRVRYTQITQIM